MSKDHTKQRFYPSKPKTREGFKRAVAWLGGRELIASLKGTIIYAIYGENMDPRSWMKANIYPNVEEKVKYQIEEDKKLKENELSSVAESQAATEVKKDKDTRNLIQAKVQEEWTRKIYEQWQWKKDHFKLWDKYFEDLDKSNPAKKTDDNKSSDNKADNNPISEFWFDYIADTGDGQLGVYGVGCMCLSDLWMKKYKAGEEVGREVRFEPPEMDEKGEIIEDLELLPRGNFLFVGGDTAYHSANYETLFERFQTPFRWAFTSVRKFTVKNYRLKKTQKEKFFFLDGSRKNVYKTSTSIEPIEEWDGTIGAIKNENTKDEKRYWDSEPLRPIFGVPANHDYYDSIDGFNKQFRRPPFEQIEENMVDEDNKGRLLLQIPTFAREQEASYIAINLPFEWWMFGIDSENEKLDFRQELFFQRIMIDKPKKLIITTPEPTTVFGKISSETAKTAKYLTSITETLGLRQPFLTDGNFEILPPRRKENVKDKDVFDQQMEMETVNKALDTHISPNDKYCRLDISGDVHHYARYWGENTRKFKGGNFWADNYASLVAGGGGAFFDSTETLIGKTLDSKKKRIRKDGTGKTADDGEDVFGEIPPQRVFPGVNDSIDRMSERLFDLWNIKKGGYVQLAGAVISIIIYFLLTHFSHASDLFLRINGNIRNDGYGAFNFSSKAPYFTGFLLTFITATLLFGAMSLNKLIDDLKVKQFEDRIDEKWDGSVYQLLLKTFPIYVSAAIYLFYVLQLLLLSEIHPFTSSYFLLIHFVITGLLIWLSMDFANWLPIRFKLTRNSTKKSYIQKVEDPNETATRWFEPILGQYSREFSYRYIPSYILVLLAIANLIFGMRVFGNQNLARTFADLLLMIVVLGGLALISYKLAVNTGAAYHDKTRNKFQFFLIGFFHALLQLFTPFIAYYYVNKWYFPLLLAIVLLLNGIPFSSTRIRTFPFLKKILGTKSLFYKFTDFQGAAYIMKRSGRGGGWKLLTFCWVLYGLLFLFVPFLIIYCHNESQSFGELINSYVTWFFSGTIFDPISGWIYPGVSLGFIAYFGYYLSRVWFSWYLAVSLAFNGHNNEAGGAARIEGFKHILRIKVEKDQLTVFVIGFDEAEHTLEKLKLKLVDKFTLKCKPIL